MQPGTSAKSHWINYILLWKNEIYSGKHLEKSWKNDPERLCEPCSQGPTGSPAPAPAKIATPGHPRPRPKFSILPGILPGIFSTKVTKNTKFSVHLVKRFSVWWTIKLLLPDWHNIFSVLTILTSIFLYIGGYWNLAIVWYNQLIDFLYLGITQVPSYTV